MTTERRELNGGDAGVWDGHLREHEATKDQLDRRQESHLREHGLVWDAHRQEHATLAHQLDATAKAFTDALDKNTEAHWQNHAREHEQSEKALTKLERYADERAAETNKRFEAQFASLTIGQTERDKAVDAAIARFEAYIAGQQGISGQRIESKQDNRWLIGIAMSAPAWVMAVITLVLLVANK